MRTLYDKDKSDDLEILQDKNEKYKYYIMLDGYIIGVQYNLGSK